MKLLILLFLFLIYSPTTGVCGDALLTWDAPTTNTDGTPLEDLSGYKVYYGPSSGVYTSNIDAGNFLSYNVVDLQDGMTYYFAATAYDTSANESDYSNEVSKIIEPHQRKQKIINLRFRSR